MVIALKKSETINNLKKTWIYVKSNKKTLFIFLGYSLLLSLFGAITPILAAQSLLKISNNLLDQVAYIALIVLFIEIVKNVFHYFSQKAGQMLFGQIILALQSNITKTLLKVETKKIDTTSSGVFIDRMTKETSDIANIFPTLGEDLINIITNVGIMAAIFIVNKYIFLFFVIAILILFWFRKNRMRAWYESNKEYRKQEEINTSLITEIVRGLRDIKILNAGKNVMKVVNEKLSKSHEKRNNTNMKFHKYRLFTGVVQGLIDFSFTILAIYLVKNSVLSIASFVILFMYRSRVYGLIDFLAELVEEVKRFDVSAGRVFELLDEEKYPKETFGNKHVEKIHGDFEFKNVNFSYKEDRAIIKNLSFKIKANTTTAFVGKSGSGKSTIFNLLTGLYHINDGEILIDGINLDELDEDSIRGNITVITQSPYIFNFSIKENLKIVNEKATNEDIIKACKKASLHNFIMSLPNKYDTLIGEGGVMLSGGERQRLAIARALIKNSEIILFDEATSSLDNQTQMEIQEAINNIKGTYTILIIAHRLSTVMDSERIIVIDKGEIVGEGNHKELYQKNKLYRELYEKELTEKDK